MVRAGLWNIGRDGPFFSNESVTAETYLKLLNGEVWPAISWNVKREKLWFHQDVDPAHYGRFVRQMLGSKFPKRWIGRQSVVPWPARNRCETEPSITSSPTLARVLYSFSSLCSESHSCVNSHSVYDSRIVTDRDWNKYIMLFFIPRSISRADPKLDWIFNPISPSFRT